MQPINNLNLSQNQYKTISDNTNFNRDFFEVCIDVNGFAPKDISINVLRHKIEVYGQQSLMPLNSSSLVTQKSMTMSRLYELPQAIIPERTQCIFSNNGNFLKIIAPWAPV